MILTKIIETSKATILVIGGLSEDARNIRLLEGGWLYELKDIHTLIWQMVNDSPKSEYIKGLTGKWQPLGFLKDIPEDVAKGLVATVSLMGEERYNNYHLVFGGMHGEWFARAFNTAKESIVSLVEANVRLKNKYGDEPKVMTHCNGDPKVAEIVTSAFKKQWQAEQEKVFNNPFLLKKIS